MSLNPLSPHLSQLRCAAVPENMEDGECVWMENGVRVLKGVAAENVSTPMVAQHTKIRYQDIHVSYQDPL